MVPAEVCVAKLDVDSADAAIRALANRLHAKGHVRESFVEAALKREKRSPTGLPFVPVAVALPHAEPEHVVVQGIAIASLAKPVRFRQMGSPATVLLVELVVMPALTSKEQAAGTLASLIGILQDEALRKALTTAATSDELARALAARWGHT
jgi:PTS system galactitol-specific IIA component